MENIKQEVDNLIKLIKESPVYKEHANLETKVNDNKDISYLVKDIKQLQQQAVKAQYKDNKKELTKLEALIETKIKSLYNIPIYQDYIEAAEQLNDVLKEIKKRMEHFIDKI